jgi:hypothetical protein
LEALKRDRAREREREAHRRAGSRLHRRPTRATPAGSL